MPTSDQSAALKEALLIIASRTTFTTEGQQLAVEQAIVSYFSEPLLATPPSVAEPAAPALHEAPQLRLNSPGQNTVGDSTP